MKITTTIHEIIQSELIDKKGLNEFYTDNQIIFYDDEHQFLHKIQTYDIDVQGVCNRTIFGVGFTDNQLDVTFKRMFVNKFVNRQIAHQTIDLFRSQFIYKFMAERDYIEYIFTNYLEFIKRDDVRTSVRKSNGTSDVRTATNNQPQDRVNLDLNNDVLEWASDNNISKNKDSNDTSVTDTQKIYDLDALEKFKGKIDEIFNDFDRFLFLQIG